MKTNSYRWSIENWVTRLVKDSATASGPVDLYAIARLKRVRRLSLRFIIPRGALLPVQDGFEVYLQHPKREDLDVCSKEPQGLLTTRQRFALAHEIAHTYFYDLSKSVPTPTATAPSGRELERLCNRAAGHLLLPTWLLKNEVGGYERVDADLVRHIARHFNASLEVTIDRLAAIEPSNPLERCVLLVRRVQGDAVIRALYFGVGLLRTIRRPEKYSRLSEWIPDFPRQIISQHADHEWESIRTGSVLVFRKTELGGGHAFLLQAQQTLDRGGTASGVDQATEKSAGTRLH